MAASSCVDAFRLVRSVLPDALIDDRGWKKILATAERLPPSAADAIFGFECRLDDPEAAADLLLSIPRNSSFADALAVSGGSAGPKAAALARLLSKVRHSGTPFERTVGRAALEYDLVGVEGFPAPGVFLCSVDDGGFADAGMLTKAIAESVGWRPDGTERKGVAKIIDALPADAAIRWAGAFPERGSRAVRLLVRGLADGCAAFLSRIGWTGDSTALDRVVSAFRARGIDNHVVALEVAEGRVSPGLGLELSRPGNVGRGWGEAIEMMSGENWCLPSKVAALDRAHCNELIFSRKGVSEIHCGLHHVKIGFAAQGRSDIARLGDCIVGAKAYIACVLRSLQ